MARAIYYRWKGPLVMTEKLHFFDIMAVDPKDQRPLYAQVYGAIRRAILDGMLRPGMRLPSTRALAGDLNIARNTVITAFEQLTAEGYVETLTGSGTRVARLPQTIFARNRRRVEDGTKGRIARARRLSLRGRGLGLAPRYLPTYEHPTFAPGLPSIEEFPQRHWARILGRCARQSQPCYCDYSHMGGLRELRAAIVDHLGAARGVKAEPAQIIVLASAQAALDIVTRLTLDPGEVAWIENPGYLGARAAFLNAGASLHPIPMDAQGIDIAYGRSQNAKSPKLIYTTPSHQCPTGTTMSLTRRLELLEYAYRAGSWIIEDDYDSEFRYRGSPIASLQGLDREGCVIYMGTFSKTMFPGLRIGYVVAPLSLVDALEVAVCHTGQAAPKLLQAALAIFLVEGHFAEHVRRMRRVYAERQRIFISELHGQLSGRLTVQRSDTGIQLIGYLEASVDDRQATAAAERLKIAAPPLSRFYLGEAARPGLFLGYAATREDRIAAGVRELARALDRVTIRKKR
jgi:GntR family transcriptional regulator / MocR family aminotransferase